MNKTPNDIVVFLLVTTSIIILMGIFVITLILFYRKKQIAFLKNIDNIKAEFEKTILSTRLEVQEQTFQNISREIHDNIGISLTLAKLNLNTLKLSDRTHVQKQIISSISLISQAISDLNDISQGLNAEYIASYGLINSLKQETEKLKKLQLHSIGIEISGETVFMDSQKDLIIFRIAQEALNNILKHAEAKNIYIRLSYYSDNLKLTIEDDGKGFNNLVDNDLSSKKKGSGFINMKKRAEMINGQWLVESKPGKGTSINLLVPY